MRCARTCGHTSFARDVESVQPAHHEARPEASDEPQRVARRITRVTVSFATVLALPDARGDRLMRRQLAHLSDEALVALVARGDETALAELYDRVGRVAFGLALRVLRDDRLAEDAVQEAFLAVWRTAARFTPERAKASTWILTLVHRRAVDLVRREERRRTEPLGEEGQEASTADSAEAEAWLGFERDRVQAALRALPDAQREAIELAYYGGFSQSELAERLGQPLGTIKSRMFAGLARLRELLDDGAEEGSWTPEYTS
jgi:RNA polymerase sigma factor (sigma-70 family)